MKGIENILDNFKNMNIKENLEKSLKSAQETFLKSKLGQVINSAVDIGIKIALPDWLDDEIIEIKNSVLNEGFKEGIQMAIDKAIKVGKNLEGIVTGNFESIEQIKSVLKRGGLLNSMSKLLDEVISWAKKKKIISSSTAKYIKSGKKAILETIEKSIEDNLENQVLSIEKIDGYVTKWTNYYQKQDFTNMKKIYNKIQKEMQKIIPLKDVLDKVENLSNIQELIENNGKNFDLSNEELELANMLV